MGGWAGFSTQDLDRCQVTARLIAQIYNCLGRPGIYVQARSFLAGDGFGMDVQYHSLDDSA